MKNSIMKKLRFAFLIVFLLIGSNSLLAAKSNVTKEQFFDVIENQINSTLTESALKKAATRGVSKVKFGYNITIGSKTHYWGNLSKDIMQNSYGVGKIKYEFSDLSSGFQYVLADAITYYTQKHYCASYNPQAKICSKPVKESLLILNDTDKVKQIEGSAYPQLLAFYKDYAAFVEGIIKERMAKLKPSGGAAVVIQKSTAKQSPKIPPQQKIDTEAQDPKPLGIEMFVWKTDGFKSLEEVQGWIDVGFNKNRTIVDFKKVGFDSPKKAMAWNKAGFNTRPLIAFALESEKAGFTIAEAKSWKDAGLSGSRFKDILKWKKAGISAHQAKKWKDNGFSISGDVPKEWIKGGFSPSEAKQWKRAYVPASQAVVFRKKGIYPSDTKRIDWEKHTSDFSHGDKKKWESSGYSYPYMLKLMRYKLTAKDLPLLKRLCPNQIEFSRMGFFGVKGPHDVKGKCYYYLGQRHLQPRGKKAVFRSGTNRKYHYAHLVFKGKVPSYIQAIVKGLGPVEMNSSASGRNMIPSGQVVFVKFQK